MQIKMKKLAAVTLVELLLVLSIIGFVSALTLPGLKKHSQKSEYAALAKKGFVALDQSIDMASSDNEKEIGDFYGKESGERPGSVLLQNYLKKYMNYVKDCTGEGANESECLVSYQPFKGGETIVPSTRSVIMTDGIVIAGASATDGDFRFIIDVNADNLPNREGYDVFLFNYAKYNPNCEVDEVNGQWKLCPVGHAKQLVEDGWRITYW